MDTEVLVVGGGPVGLSAALQLGRLGVSTILVEKYPGSNPHPRARSVNVRTSEVFRAWGVLDDIIDVSLPSTWTERMTFCRTLSEPEVGSVRMSTQGTIDGVEYSPCPYLLSAQDLIEPVLRRHAEALITTDLRFATELMTFRHLGESRGDTEGGVEAVLRSKDGSERTVRAAWMIAADGANSMVRRNLGIDLVGRERLAYLVNTYFRADLGPWTDHRPAILYWTTAPTRNVFQKIDHERWQCQISYSPTQYRAEDFDASRAAAWIRESVGVPDLEVDVRNAVPWTMSCAVAERFRDGRVLLAGDAAHQLPPSGGFGMNTGIQDSHNLAWKLAMVIRGEAADRLLDSYDVERRPVATFNANWSLANSQNVGVIRRSIEGEMEEADLALLRRYTHMTGMDLGLSYEDGAFVPDGTAAPEVADRHTDYAPTARPGHRSPHVSLRAQGGSVTSSTLDLFDRDFVLLTRSALWRAVDGPVSVQLVGTKREAALVDPNGDFESTYGIGADGAVLVRPDGMVGARFESAPADPNSAVRAVMEQILS